MSWVRVECSNGLQVSAPSFSPPPRLQGLDALFSSTLPIRELHCFTCTDSTGTDLGMDEGNAEVIVLFSQWDSGASLGKVFIAVGGTDIAVSGLEVLREATLALLQSTSGKGLQIGLDALCSRMTTPLDFTTDLGESDWRTHSIGAEIDHASLHQRIEGALLYPSCEPLESGVPYGHVKSNRNFLKAMCRGEPGSEGVPAAGDANPNALFLPSSSSSEQHEAVPTRGEVSRQAALVGVTQKTLPNPPQHLRGSPKSLDVVNTLARKLTESLHYARRQSLLYFVRYDTVPLSLLLSKSTYQPLHLVLPRTRGPTLASLAGQPLYRVQSLLRRSSALQTSKGNASTAFWRETIESAEELGRLLILAAQRTLCYLYPYHAEWFGRQMWVKPQRCSVHTPIFAAFSASGLLLGSGAFQHVLSHRDRFLLAAVAMNEIACAPLARPYRFKDSGAQAGGEVGGGVKMDSTDAFKHVLAVKQFPFTVRHALGGSDIIEVCIFTIGDGLSVLFSLSRASMQQRGISIQTLVDGLSSLSTVPPAPADASSSSPPTDPTAAEFDTLHLLLGRRYVKSLCFHLHTLCVENLMPTQAFFSSVCALDLLERGLFFDKKREELIVVQELERALHSGGGEYYPDGGLVPDFSEEAGGAPAGNAQEHALPFVFPVDSDVSRVGCLPFFCGRKSKGVDTETFAARRVSLGKERHQKVQSCLGGQSSELHSAASKKQAQFHREMLLLTLPPGIMWAYIAAKTGVTERLSFRSLEGVGVHSAFWMQKRGLGGVEDKPQFSLGFFRHRLELGHAPECEQEESSERPGRLRVWVEQPSKTVELRADVGVALPNVTVEDGSGAALGSQVSVLPLALLETPVSSPLHSLFTEAPLTPEWIEKAVPPPIKCAGEESGDEPEGLITSLYLASQAKLTRVKHKRVANQPGSSNPTAAQDSKEAAAVRSDSIGTAHTPSREEIHSQQKGSSQSFLVDIEEVINVAGDLRGEEWNVLHALAKRRQPKAYSKYHKPEVFDEAKCSTEIRELCAQLSLCKEAVITLFHAASTV